MAQGFVVRVKAAGSDEVLKEQIARLLCPAEDHPPPCEVPWAFTASDPDRDFDADREGAADRDTGVDGADRDGSGELLLAIYTTPGKAADVVERLKSAFGRPVELRVGDPADFEDLATQYRIENGLTSSEV